MFQHNQNLTVDSMKIKDSQTKYVYENRKKEDFVSNSIKVT